MNGRDISIEDLHKQAWDYFHMHADQRLTTFNFFIVLSSVITTALIASLRGESEVPFLGVLFGLLLTLFSFVFWKLDSRNKQLIKAAEAALKFFESLVELEDTEDEPHVARLFLREEYDTRRIRRRKSILFWRNFFSYSDCFKMVFVSFCLIGVLGMVISIVIAM